MKPLYVSTYTNFSAVLEQAERIHDYVERTRRLELMLLLAGNVGLWSMIVGGLSGFWLHPAGIIPGLVGLACLVFRRYFDGGVSKRWYLGEECLDRLTDLLVESGCPVDATILQRAHLRLRFQRISSKSLPWAITGK